MPISGKQVFPCPMIIRPHQAYKSPVDGTVIHDDRQRREHMRRHDLEDAPPMDRESRIDRHKARVQAQEAEQSKGVQSAIRDAIQQTGVSVE